jgi:hypothetical protein
VEYRPGARGRSVAKRRMVLGSANTLTPEQARNAAREVLASVALGEDPAASRSAAREMPTFRDFAARYLAEEAQAKLKPRTVVNYEICLRKHAIPVIGSLKLDRVATSDIAKMHRLIGETKPMTANRVVECVSSIYRYAAISGLVLRGHKSHFPHRGFPRAAPRTLSQQRGTRSAGRSNPRGGDHRHLVGGRRQQADCQAHP